MADVKTSNINPIGWYCFILAFTCLFNAFNEVLKNKAILSGASGGMVWVIVAACIILGCGLVAVGIGIIKLSKICWKILFFGLAITISSAASLLFAFLVFLVIDSKIVTPYVQLSQIGSGDWYSFLAIFISGIIVLYYLTTEEVVSHFGEMGPLISPF